MIALVGDGPAVLDLLTAVDAAVAAQVMGLVRLEYRNQAVGRIEALQASPNLKGWFGEVP